MSELARHEGWLAPSRFFRRLLDALSGDTLGIAARVLFAAMLVASIAAIAVWLARRGAARGPAAWGGAWAWGLLLLMLLGPVLLPWYAVWSLPLVWLLPRVPRASLIGTGVALTLSGWTAEPSRFTRAYDLNVLFGHYVLTPIVILLLAWTGWDLWRRLREGRPLEDDQARVPAQAGQG
jgi:hypothetical protein